MKRDVSKIKENDNEWEKNSFKGQLGTEGEYYIGKDENSIIDYNIPPSTQPELWCDWIINDNDELVWDGIEKFYSYKEWLIYLISNFFKPNNYILNGVIEFKGEYENDQGFIEVHDNNVHLFYN